MRDIFQFLKDLVRRHPLAAGSVLTVIFLIFIPVSMQKMVIGLMERDSTRNLPVVAGIDETKARLEKETRQVERKLAAFVPRSHYLVINSSSNRFILYRGGLEVWSGRCSTGSYILLKNGEEQQWMFKTPKGEFRILGKTANPVWKKPDWAFIEEGLPVPPFNHASRFEFGVLGDYALSLGDGYLIHGTLFQRYLGLPVTHGCIRLGDRDLQVVYNALNNGSKVFIY
jgi:L,D-transpeptidase ErfK/SrfK